MNEGLVLFLMSLPMLFIFAMCIYYIVLLLMVDEELEADKSQETKSANAVKMG